MTGDFRESKIVEQIKELPEGGQKDTHNSTRTVNKSVMNRTRGLPKQKCEVYER